MTSQAQNPRTSCLLKELGPNASSHTTMTAVFRPKSLSTTHLVVVLNFVYVANAQIGYRERARSPARIIAGAVIGAS